MIGHPGGGRLTPLGLLAFAIVLLSPVSAGAVPVGTVELFATLPGTDQGHPMGVAVRDGNVYAATGMWVGSDFMDNRPPTRGGAVYVYPLAGVSHAQPSATWRLQDRTDEQMGLDVSRDAVYTVAWDKVLRFDRLTGAQETYAKLPDLPTCKTGKQPCQPADSPPGEDRRAMGSGLAVAPGGTVYVADLFQGTIWRIPAGRSGRIAERWFQDGRLGGQVIGGAGGMIVSPDGRSLLVAMDDDSRIYELPLTASPNASDLKEVFAFDDPPGSARRPRCSFTSGADCPYPEGLAFGASGRLYVVLSGLQAVSVLEKGPGGFQQVGFYPTVLRTGETAGAQTVPYGIAFSDDGWIIVTNDSFLADDPAQFALLRMYVGEKGAPRPAEPTPGGAGVRRCLARRARVGARGVGPIRLGHTRERLLRRTNARPVRRTRRSFRYCVKGSSGRVSAVFNRRSGRGKALLVTTTARSHRARRVGRGVRTRVMLRRFPRARRIGRRLYRAGPGSRTLIGVRAGRVRYLAAASAPLLRSRRALRSYLRLAGVSGKARKSDSLGLRALGRVTAGQLHDSGALSDEEFADAKRKLLEDL